MAGKLVKASPLEVAANRIQMLDQFAGLAMAGMLRPQDAGTLDNAMGRGKTQGQVVAWSAYKMADYMCQVREKVAHAEVEKALAQEKEEAEQDGGNGVPA
jgi:hypothetical protein